MTSKNTHPATRCAQALGAIDPTTKALVPPLHAATTFEREADLGYPQGFSYSRNDGPTQKALEAVLADLEGAADALAFASGMSAAAAVFLALRPGDHVLAQQTMYWGLRKWLLEVARPWGLEVDFVPAGDVGAIEAAIKPGRTRLVWLESPANPTWEVVDLAAASRVVHEAGALIAVDSTVATPVLTRPIAHGVDIVMHSATKYLNGHSDVLAGALMTQRNDAFWAQIKEVRKGLGGILAPFESWLLLRGVRTLFVRVRQASKSAEAIALHFEHHPKVTAVLYPGLESHPGHAVAKRQMVGGFGGMLSIRVKGGEAGAVKVAARLHVFKRATSLGGVESLVEHRASIEGAGSPCPPDLLRLSVGIEDTGDLVADLDQALAGV
ncbi:MAG: PLP-dependent transferase [Proteobacteria bacterium]|nr:PLP-dependent transferase [Pseudomonadota bacterium]MBI3499671.1 PLP-dependent transferase [Pseudomonadota bacterium]